MVNSIYFAHHSALHNLDGIILIAVSASLLIMATIVLIKGYANED